MALPDEVVDAVGVVAEGPLQVWAKIVDLLLQLCIGVASLEHLFVRAGVLGAEDLGHPAARESSAQLHLPEPILSHRVAGSSPSIVDRRGGDVRDAVVVAGDVALGRRQSEAQNQVEQHSSL